ncbi:hypothetical protein FRZ06_07990 [Anoxybacterium hadale]|uniref:Uncharacterized protein n=1 Tax=Anoxybacterium hadale TaxID=3408580 RepID=A0ACD1AA05_9FIRM|nr:hypothetical protein FRZ06_07990 [Clostridiales bacterium]
MVYQYKVTEIEQRLSQPFDLFIGCSSFELRCLSFIQNIDIERFTTALVFYNKDCLDHITSNSEKMEGIIGERGTFVELLHSDPIYTADQIKNALLTISEKKKVNSILLDITTFTHESLLITVRLLRLIFPLANIQCAYINAREYSSNDKMKNKWLSKGILEIRSVLGYAGNILPARKTHLILIVGYEYERATGIINTLEPNSISLGFGRSDNATTQKDREANEHYARLVEQMATNYVDLDCFEVKCNDPFETSEAILKKLEGLEDTNVLIVPLNNKISTIGVAMAAISNGNVQACYAPALIYNYDNYSEPGDICYIFELPLLRDKREEDN